MAPLLKRMSCCYQVAHLTWQTAKMMNYEEVLTPALALLHCVTWPVVLLFVLIYFSMVIAFSSSLPAGWPRLIISHQNSVLQMDSIHIIIKLSRHPKLCCFGTNTSPAGISAACCFLRLSWEQEKKGEGHRVRDTAMQWLVLYTWT